MTAIDALLANLQQAANLLKKLGKHRDLLSKYDSAEHLAAFLEAMIPQLRSSEISDENLNELWRIFAPTSEWDDYVGNIDLGEAIFEDLNSIERR